MKHLALTLFLLALLSPQLFALSMSELRHQERSITLKEFKKVFTKRQNYRHFLLHKQRVQKSHSLSTQMLRHTMQMQHQMQEKEHHAYQIIQTHSKEMRQEAQEVMQDMQKNESEYKQKFEQFYQKNQGKNW